MDPVFKDALIRLARVTITAGIMAAIVAFLKVGTAADAQTLASVVITAFLTGAVNALMEYLRTTSGTVVTPAPAPATITASTIRVKRAGAFQLRTKNVFDYFPI